MDATYEAARLRMMLDRGPERSPRQERMAFTILWDRTHSAGSGGPGERRLVAALAQLLDSEEPWKTAPERKRRIVMLFRVSTESSAERDTLEAQRQALDQLLLTPARRSGGPHRAVRRREAARCRWSSGRRLQRLRVHCEAKDFTELWVFDGTRLGRHADPRVIVRDLGMVQDCGGVIVDAQGNVLEPHGRVRRPEVLFPEQGRRGGAREDRTAHRGRAPGARGHREEAGGRTPFGLSYDTDGKLWSLHPTQAPVVNRMYEWSAYEGISCKGIADRLERESVRPPKGDRWRTATVNLILRSEVYVGTKSYTVGGESSPSRCRRSSRPSCGTPRRPR